jgi:ribosomal protein S18 acetylase RimI-like enzyme
MTASDALVVVGPLTPGPLCDQVLDLAATGRAGLAALLGDATQRHALFRPGMRADRFLVATVGGELAGYLSLKHGGQGPFAPSLGDFIRCQGWRRGLHAWAVFGWIEARTRPRPGGGYIYGLDVLKPFRGHKHGRDVGGALMQAAVRATARLGLTSLDMEIRRPAIRALVTRMGAVPVVAPRLSLTRLLMATAGDYQRMTIAVAPEREPQHVR